MRGGWRKRKSVAEQGMKEGTLPSPLPLVLFKFSAREISTSSDLLPSLSSLSSSLSLVSLAADTEGKKVRRQPSGEDSVAHRFVPLYQRVYMYIYACSLLISNFSRFYDLSSSTSPPLLSLSRSFRIFIKSRLLPRTLRIID